MDRRSRPISLTLTRNSGSSATVELRGYVTSLDLYAIPSFEGGCAMLALQNSPHNVCVAVLTQDARFQNIFATALASKLLVTVHGEQILQKTNPQGDRWADEVYVAYRLIVAGAG